MARQERLKTHLENLVITPRTAHTDVAGDVAFQINPIDSVVSGETGGTANWGVTEDGHRVDRWMELTEEWTDTQAALVTAAPLNTRWITIPGDATGTQVPTAAPTGSLVISTVGHAAGTSFSGFAGTGWNTAYPVTNGIAAEFRFKLDAALDLNSIVECGFCTSGGIVLGNDYAIIRSADITGVLSGASANATVVGTSTFAPAVSLTAATYYRCKVTVLPTGNVRYYVNGVWRGATALAVATTATLCPYFKIIMGATHVQARTCTCDYVKLWIGRLVA